MQTNSTPSQRLDAHSSRGRGRQYRSGAVVTSPQRKLRSVFGHGARVLSPMPASTNAWKVQCGMVERFAIEVINIEFICKYDAINYSIVGVVLGSLRGEASLSRPCQVFQDVAFNHITFTVVSFKSA